MDATYILYTGIATPYIPIAAGQNLQTILQNIDTAINTHNTAPNYTDYILGPWGTGNYTVVKTNGGQVLTTQDFAEGVSKILGVFQSAFYTFRDTTYAANQATISAAITGLQAVAGVNYSHSGGGITYTIPTTPTITQIMASANGVNPTIGLILDKLNSPGTNWISSGISGSQPTTLTAAFNTLNTYIMGTITSAIAGKQAQIGNYNNSANCLTALAGTSHDNIFTTVTLLRQYTCSLPTYDATSITGGVIIPGTTLEDSIQSIANVLSDVATNAATTPGAGITLTPAGYNGQIVALDLTTPDLYRVAINSTGAGLGNINYLEDAIIPGTGIGFDNIADNQLIVNNTLPETYKIKINSYDTLPDYIATKIAPYSVSDWGIFISTQVINSNGQLQITASLDNPTLFFTRGFQYVLESPTLKAMLCNLVASCDISGACAAPVWISWAVSGFNLGFQWTPNGVTPQNFKYRHRGSTVWLLSPNLSLANPLGSAVVAVTLLAPNVNIVYENVIEAVCTVGTSPSPIMEAVIYAPPMVYPVGGVGVISCSVDPIPTADTVDIRFKRHGTGTVQSTIQSTSGLPASNPTVVGVTISNLYYYDVEIRINSTVNGVTLSSDIASQMGIGVWCSYASALSMLGGGVIANSYNNSGPGYHVT